MNRSPAVVAMLLIFHSIIISSAHPASGLVVDPEGQVFFVYTGHGVCKIDGRGKVTNIHRSKGGHWMCLDSAGIFSKVQPKFFRRITPDGTSPALIFADGGAPLAVNTDGYLYFGSNPSENGSMPPGGLSVSQMSTAGDLKEFSPPLRAELAKMNQGVTGLATGPNGILYVATPSAIFKVSADGVMTTFLNPVLAKDCDPDPADHIPSNPLPFVRGLAISTNGTVYAAGTSCHCVLKVTSDGHVKTVLKAERPWSPTGVALHGEDLYILEYSGANGGKDEGWLPRVRKLAPSGKVTTLVTITGQEQL